MGVLEYLLNLTGAADEPGKDRTFVQRLLNKPYQPKLISPLADAPRQQEWNPVRVANAQQPAPTPTPSPQVQGDSSRRLALENYRGGSTVPIPNPPRNVENLIWENFPNEATSSAVALWGENAGMDLNAVNRNNDGTVDYGLWQLNSKTLKDMLSKVKYRRLLENAGVLRPTDVLGDAQRATKAAAITRQYEKDAGAAPWSWWYGWQNKGANILPDEYSSIGDLSRKTYDSGNPAYFKLAEFVKRNSR